MKSHLHVKQTGSTIGTVDHLRKVMKGLGLRGLGSDVTVANTPSFRGMVKKVIHLVAVEEVDQQHGAGAAARSGDAGAGKTAPKKAKA